MSNKLTAVIAIGSLAVGLGVGGVVGHQSRNGQVEACHTTVTTLLDGISHLAESGQLLASEAGKRLMNQNVLYEARMKAQQATTLVKRASTSFEGCE